jgi:hypothetical protein
MNLGSASLSRYVPRLDFRRGLGSVTWGTNHIQLKTSVKDWPLNRGRDPPEPPDCASSIIHHAVLLAEPSYSGGEIDSPCKIAQTYRAVVVAVPGDPATVISEFAASLHDLP